MSDPVRLDDAALRERAYRWCGANQTTYSEWTVDELTTAFIAIRDAARAEAPPYNRLCDCGSGLMVRSCNLCVARAMAVARAEQREVDAKVVAAYGDDKRAQARRDVDDGNETFAAMSEYGVMVVDEIAAALRAQEAGR